METPAAMKKKPMFFKKNDETVSMCFKEIILLNKAINNKVIPIILTGIGKYKCAEIIFDKRTNK